MRDWHEKFIRATPLFTIDPEAVEQERLRAQLKRYTEGKKIPDDDLKKLRAAGFIKGETSNDQPTAAAPETGNGAVPVYIAGQAALARFLQLHFRERIVITINAQTLQDWREGKRLEPLLLDGKFVHPPPFPNKNESGNRWVVRECIDWVERWIVPVKKPKSDGNGLIPYQDYDEEVRQYNLRKMRREEAIEEGAYISFELAVRVAGGVVEKLWQATRSRIEKFFLSQLMEQWRGAGFNDEQIARLREFQRIAGQTAVDEIAAECQKRAKTLEQELKASNDERKEMAV